MSRHRNARVAEGSLELAGLAGFAADADWRWAVRWLKSNSASRRLAAVKAFYFGLGCGRIHRPRRQQWREQNIERLLRSVSVSDRSSEVPTWSPTEFPYGREVANGQTWYLLPRANRPHAWELD